MLLDYAAAQGAAPAHTLPRSPAISHTGVAPTSLSLMPDLSPPGRRTSPQGAGLPCDQVTRSAPGTRGKDTAWGAPRSDAVAASAGRRRWVRAGSGALAPTAAPRTAEPTFSGMPQ
jgi:hypothetical protein